MIELLKSEICCHSNFSEKPPVKEKLTKGIIIIMIMCQEKGGERGLTSIEDCVDVQELEDNIKKSKLQQPITALVT